MNEPDLICQSTVKDLLLNWGPSTHESNLSRFGNPPDSLSSEIALVMPETSSPSPKSFKKLAIFLDGTWQSENANTNVWRLKSLCAKSDAGGNIQLIYYDKGLGTTSGSILRGGVFGYGIDDAVINAYEWLIENFDDGDEIFIFGFSRGAYTTRSLSGFISRCGLLVPGSPLSIRQLYNRYRKGNEVATIRELHQNPNDPRCGLEEKRLVKHGRPISVKFTGVWDTVGALSDTGDFVILTGGDHDFLDVNLRRSDEFAFHALAIDEHREDFAATLFTRYAPKTGPDPVPPRRLDEVEQRWFVGDHSNVGGGTDNDLLPQVPLKWMMGKAALHGLAFRSPIELEEGLTNAPIDDSYSSFLKGTYKLLRRPYYRPIGREPEERTETIVHAINESIHSSVFERWRDDETYRPKNLADWATAKGVKIEELDSSRRADDPSQIIPDSTPGSLV